MKKILLLLMVLFFWASYAQEFEKSIRVLEVENKVAFSNSFFSTNNDAIKTTLDIYSLGYQYKLPEVEYQIFPNPVNMGDYVTISPVELGEVVTIFKPTGVFVQSQVIDVDKRIRTIDLPKGEYIVSTENAILNLLVE